jgi:farnesyl diphosphate synthase
MRSRIAATMDPDLAFAVWSSERARRIESVLERALTTRTEAAGELHRAMRYAVLGGGKRVRALLAYAGGELSDAEPEIVDAAAAAVELIHAYSLVHDDLPCMDDDVLRRGRPTCHVAFGEATALLAGDALQSLAFEVLAAGMRDAGMQLSLLARAAGAAGMAGGQALDLANTGKDLTLSELEAMHALKTGALIRAAVRLGAGCGRPMAAGENEALDRYSSAIGLGFQVVDDVLDVEGTAQSLGKTAGKDAVQRKPTYVSLSGLAAARERIELLRVEARAALSSFGPPARRLLEIADWIAQRKN